MRKAGVPSGRIGDTSYQPILTGGKTRPRNRLGNIQASANMSRRILLA